MLNDIDKTLMFLEDMQGDYSQHRAVLMTACASLKAIKISLIEASGFKIVFNHLDEFLKKGWSKESLLEKHTLVTKKCLAQKIEPGDEILEIKAEHIKIKKATGREWIFQNDTLIHKQGQC